MLEPVSRLRPKPSSRENTTNPTNPKIIEGTAARFWIVLRRKKFILLGRDISFKYIAAPTPEGSANRMANEIKYTEPRITGPIPALIDLDEGKLVKKL